MKNQHPKNSIICLIALTCLGLASTVRAICEQGCDLDKGNTFLGDDALSSNTTGTLNTAVGATALSSNTTGDTNTAIGKGALFSNTKGFSNVAIGVNALFHNTITSDNTALGGVALFNNTLGTQNTAVGSGTLFQNTTGSSNSATGSLALSSNTTGKFNTANGSGALLENKTGDNNTATGSDALEFSTGNNNTATGAFALRENIANSNTADGHYALGFNTTGSNNTATGGDSLLQNTTGGNNTADGRNALRKNTGSGNIGLGFSAGSALTTGDNNIDIGNKGVAEEAKTIRLGTTGTQANAYIAGISGVAVADGVGVIIDTSGHLGTVVSSARYKEAIQPMDKTSEAILTLQPVTFRYKKDLDPDGIPQFGLVAEQVAKVNPDLVARDADGRPYTVRYEAVNAMLLNEFLKEHRKMEELEATVTQLQAAFKEQAAQIQRVSDQLRTQAPAPRVVAND